MRRVCIIHWLHANWCLCSQSWFQGGDVEDGLEDVENLYTNLKDDVIGASYLKMAQSMSFLELCAYTIELPVSEHWRPEVKAAKRIEIKILQDYETFEEVKDEGQETLGSRWVITEKEKHDGQK